MVSLFAFIESNADPDGIVFWCKIDPNNVLK